MNSTKSEKELTYVVTDEMYQEGLAKGWNDDDMMKPGTYKVRRSRWAEKLKTKIKVSIYLDAEIVEYFRGRAEQPNAAPYQTQINNELRKAMENGSNTARSLDADDLLKDKKFLKALKKKLETV